jgi:hypothetical protein
LGGDLWRVIHQQLPQRTCELLLYLSFIDRITLPETDNRFLAKLIVAMDATNKSLPTAPTDHRLS